MTVLTKTATDCRSASFDVDTITDNLSVIADWRDDLRSRIARAVMIFELHDVDFDFTALAAEVAAFSRVVACIRWR